MDATAFNNTLMNTDLSGCAVSVVSCFSNITALLLPSGCGLPPDNLMKGEMDISPDTIKWAQCACPSLVPVVSCLNAGVESCPALKDTLAQYSPLVESGCALLAGTGSNSSANGTNPSTNGTSTNSTGKPTETGKASMGFSVQASLVSFLAMALLL